MSRPAGPYLRGPGVARDPVTLAGPDLHASLAETYDAVVAAANARGDLWQGWKLGGSNHASRQAFGVDEIYYGALTGAEILHMPDVAPGLALCELKGEVEIALRIGPDGTAADAWCVALEMPASPVVNLMECGIRALVADRCAAGALLLGPVSQMPLPPLGTAVLTLEQDGAVLDAAGLEALTAPPERQFSDFLAMARRHGLVLRPGQWVATGGITRCCALREGGPVRVLLDGVAHLDVQIATDRT